jgi:hypothetical protein
MAGRQFVPRFLGRMADRAGPFAQHPVRRAIMQNIAAVAQRVIARAPRWLKQDLLKDGREREQAENMLAAMIEAALRDPQATEHDAPSAIQPCSLGRAEPRLAEDGHLIA